MYYQKLKNQLFVDINYPQSLTDLIGDAKEWSNFCKLSLELKTKFSFPDRQKETDTGYFWRSKEEGREDKEYFHTDQNMREFIKADKLDKIVEDNSSLKDFFEYTEKIYDAAHNFAFDIGKEMGKEIPQLGKLVEGNKINSVLRLLHYTNKDDTEIIAAQHFDRSLYTLHLYESAPGLQFLNYYMNWTDAPIGNGKTVVFNGYRIYPFLVSLLRACRRNMSYHTRYGTPPLQVPQQNPSNLPLSLSSQIPQKNLHFRK